MRQRLGVARALLHRPRLLLLDEPFSGLDPIAAADLRQEIIALAREQRTTVFLTTHDLAHVEKACDRVAVLVKGRVIAEGPVDELRGSGGDVEVSVLGVGIDRAQLAAMKADGVITSFTLAEGRAVGPVRVTCARDKRAGLAAAFIARGVALEEITTVRASLEETFIALVGATGGSPMRDVVTVLHKELWEILGDRYARRGGLVQAIVGVLAFGFILPMNNKKLWVEGRPAAIVYYALTGIFAVAIAADAFAGERERKTLDTLLATPLSERAILFGKASAAILFALAVSTFSFVCAVVVVNVAAKPEALFLPEPLCVAAALGGACSSALLLTSLAVLLSMRLPVARTVQQIKGLAGMASLRRRRRDLERHRRGADVRELARGGRHRDAPGSGGARDRARDVQPRPVLRTSADAGVRM